MPRVSKNYDEQITVQITRPMKADLDNVVTKSGKTRAEVVRQAIRNALDETDLTLGTRRSFDRRLRKRLDEMEKHLEQMMTEHLESTRDVFVQEVVNRSLAEIRQQMARQRSEDSEWMIRYLTTIALMCAKMLNRSASWKQRSDEPLDIIAQAIKGAEGREGQYLRSRIRGGG